MLSDNSVTTSTASSGGEGGDSLESCSKDLCRVAHECLIESLRTNLGLPEGVPGIVMAIDTFGEYLDFHPHLHALVGDGLFARSGVFHVMPESGLKPLEDLFGGSFFGLRARPATRKARV